MTSDILHKRLSQLNSSFQAQNRSIILLIDSLGRHPYDFKGRYSNIKLVFFACEVHVQAATTRSQNNPELLSPLQDVATLPYYYNGKRPRQCNRHCRNIGRAAG